MQPEDVIALESMFRAASVTLAELAAEQHRIVAEIATLDRLTALSTFAAMLASPLLQANAYRLETLVHITAVKANGRKHPFPELFRRAFKSFGNGTSGRFEDP